MTTSNETTTLARYRRELAALADDALTTDEVARRLGVSRRRVQLLLHDGRLPYAEAVGQRWVRAADLAVDPRMPTGIYRDPATPRGFRPETPRVAPHPATIPPRPLPATARRGRATWPLAARSAALCPLA